MSTSCPHKGLANYVYMCTSQYIIEAATTASFSQLGHPTVMLEQLKPQESLWKAKMFLYQSIRAVKVALLWMPTLYMTHYSTIVNGNQLIASYPGLSPHHLSLAVLKWGRLGKTDVPGSWVDVWGVAFCAKGLVQQSWHGLQGPPCKLLFL